MTRAQTLRQAGNGFSLVELSVVTLIIGIFLTLGLAAMNAARESAALSATNTKQAAVREALIGYLRRNSRLPCPDTDTAAPDGVENRTTAGNPATACSQRFGVLPYVTLGLARDAVQDGWGNFFSYHVANTAGSNVDWTRTASTAITDGFRVGSTGNITVNSRSGAVVTALSTTIVATIISHGPNGLGAYTVGGTRNTLPLIAERPDELDNTNGTADMVYYRRDPTTDDAATGGPFDDVIMYLTADDLLNPLFKDGTLKPGTATVLETFTKLKLMTIGFAMTNTSAYGANCNNTGTSLYCRIIPFADNNANGTPNSGTVSGGWPWGASFGGYNGFNQSTNELTYDPWGSVITYTIGGTALATNTSGNGISSTIPAGITTAFQFVSAGPDRTFGTSDDITLTVTLSELRGHLTGLLP